MPISEIPLDPALASPGDWYPAPTAQTMQGGHRFSTTGVLTTAERTEYWIGRAHPGNGTPEDIATAQMNGRLFAASKSMAALLLEAVAFEAAAFDEDQPVSGADLVDWFTEFRQRIAVVLGTAPAAGE